MALRTLEFTGTTHAEARRARDAHYHKLQLLGHKLMTRGTTQRDGKLIYEIHYEPFTSTTSRASEAVAELESIPASVPVLAALPPLPLPLLQTESAVESLAREVSDGPIEGESGVEGTLGSDAERDSVGDVQPSGATVDGPATI